MTKFIRTSSVNVDFIKLVSLLDADLRVRDGEEHSFYAQFNKTGSIKHVIVCYEDDNPVGCGAFKKFDDHTVEIKRMFVSADMRGKGTGHAVLQQLEQWAAELGYSHCILETGKKQPEAIRLYQKSGYDFIENYGQYKGIENSICMMKKIN